MMFSIEHEFDSTVITLVDEGTAQLQEDLIINSFSECVTIEQYDARTDKINKITFSIGQLKDCLLYTSPSPRDQRGSRMPSSA